MDALGQVLAARPLLPGQDLDGDRDQSVGRSQNRALHAVLDLDVRREGGEGGAPAVCRKDAVRCSPQMACLVR